LSHLDVVVATMGPMEIFYTDVLGFEVTDRSARSGHGEMIFLSQDPDEHHQLVLRQAGREAGCDTLLDHIGFRVDSLSELRELHRLVLEESVDDIETVSHGSTWSVYVRDPEANRVEFFVDTPWPVAQPCL
jgi:catechol-2,3-dioxygenase